MFKNNMVRMSVTVAAVLVGVFATSASAIAAEYLSEKSTTELVTNKDGAGMTIGLAGFPSPCETTSVKGTMTGTAKAPGVWASQSFRTAPLITSCKWQGFKTSVEPNGCEWEFRQPTGSTSPFSLLKVVVLCPAGKEIVLKANSTGCSWTIPSQSIVGSLSLTNNAGPPKTITVNFQNTTVNYTTHGLACGGDTKGPLIGTVRVSGFKNAGTEPVNISIG